MGASFSDSPLSWLLLGPEFEIAVLWRNFVNAGASPLDVACLALTSTHACYWCRRQIVASRRWHIRSLLRSMASLHVYNHTPTRMFLGQLHWIKPHGRVPGEIYEPLVDTGCILLGKRWIRTDLAPAANKPQAISYWGIRLPIIEDVVRFALSQRSQKRKREAAAQADGEPDPKRQRTS